METKDIIIIVSVVILLILLGIVVFFWYKSSSKNDELQKELDLIKKDIDIKNEKLNNTVDKDLYNVKLGEIELLKGKLTRYAELVNAIKPLFTVQDIPSATVETESQIVEFKNNIVNAISGLNTTITRLTTGASTGGSSISQAEQDALNSILVSSNNSFVAIKSKLDQLSDVNPKFNNLKTLVNTLNDSIKALSQMTSTEYDANKTMSLSTIPNGNMMIDPATVTSNTPTSLSTDKFNDLIKYVRIANYLLGQMNTSTGGTSATKFEQLLENYNSQMSKYVKIGTRIPISFLKNTILFEIDCGNYGDIYDGFDYTNAGDYKALNNAINLSSTLDHCVCTVLRAELLPNATKLTFPVKASQGFNSTNADDSVYTSDQTIYFNGDGSRPVSDQNEIIKVIEFYYADYSRYGGGLMNLLNNNNARDTALSKYYRIVPESIIGEYKVNFKKIAPTLYKYMKGELTTANWTPRPKAWSISTLVQPKIFYKPVSNTDNGNKPSIYRNTGFNLFISNPYGINWSSNYDYSSDSNTIDLLKINKPNSENNTGANGILFLQTYASEYTSEISGFATNLTECILSGIQDLATVGILIKRDPTIYDNNVKYAFIVCKGSITLTRKIGNVTKIGNVPNNNNPFNNNEWNFYLLPNRTYTNLNFDF